MKIKQGDTVKILAGNDSTGKKPKEGKVLRILKKNDRVVVEGVNLKTKHIKKSPSRPGEKISFEAPMHVSNVMLVCSHCKKPTRVGYIKGDDNKKVRACKKCGKLLDVKKAKK